MVGRDVAVEQVLRFENYANYPSGEARKQDREEFIFAFQDAAIDKSHATAIGNWLIRRRPSPDCRFCPMPAEVYSAADATRPEDTGYSSNEESVGRRPGDEPFNGFSDLIDERISARIKEVLGEKGKARLKSLGAGK